MTRTRILSAFVATGLVAPLFAQSADRLRHLGEDAVGTVAVTQVGSVYHLTFTGDEVIDYQIDVANAGVATGLLRVYEGTSHGYPLWEGGAGYRQASGVAAPPAWLATYTALTAQSMSSDSVVLEYRDSLPPVESSVILHRRHTFTLRGKSLRVHVEDLDNTRSYLRNYCGVYQGRTDSTETPVNLYIPGALATPITLFRDGTAHYFLGSMLDLPQSNASDWVFDVQGHLSGASTSFRNNIHSFGTYNRQGTGQICASLDDTLMITVSSRLQDVLMSPSQGPSPYRELLEGRTIALLGGSSWTDYPQMWNLFDQWGMQDLAGYYFLDWVDHSRDDVPLSGMSNIHQNVGPDWWPARDPVNFATMVAAGRAKGWLLGAYMAFSDLPPSSPYFATNQGDVARTDLGVAKTDAQNGFELIASSASRTHAQREATLVARDYSLNSAYLDVQTYASPSHGADGDHIQQAYPSPWARTLKTAISQQKSWMRRMTDIYEGPMMGEGSISTSAANMEWLWAGYCDSVQRVINTNAGKNADQIAAGDPLAPTNFPVVPEFEQRVMSRLQCNHGNGFQGRFFGKSDGPGIVDMLTGEALTPATEAALDRYRAYEVTYGKTSYIFANGPYNGAGNWTYFNGIIKEYYMVNALQALYFEGPPSTIQYLFNGTLQTFEQILFSSETLTSFRDPRIKITWPNGLELYVNHSPTAWPVTAAGVAYTIPEDGFVAVQAATGFVCFSAIAPTTSGQRVDYCYAPGKWEFFDGRGNVNGYGGIDTQNKKRLRVRNFVTAGTVYEDATGHTIQTIPGTPPAVLNVQVVPATTDLAVGSRLGMKAIAHYANGAVRNVTSLVTWASSNPGVARINRGAAITAATPGVTVVTCSAFQGVACTSATLTVP